MREPLAAVADDSLRHAMAPQVVDPFATTDRRDRNFFLCLLAVAWAALVSGFGNDIATRAAAGTLHYPLVVHVHAALFVGWMLLFTTQLLLVRHARIALHRRLGMAGAVLAPAMVVAGIATAIVTETAKFGTPASDPVFLATLFGDMVAFGGIAGAGMLLRGQRASHRRLMLMATLLLSDAGFGRWFSGFIAPNYWEIKGFAEGIGPYLRYQLMPAGSLLLAIGLYDLATRRRLLPAYVAAFAFWLVVGLSAAWLYYSPAWLPVALRLVGH